jgi:hypothetical protein
VTAAEILLTDLRAADIEVDLDAAGEVRCRSWRGVLTAELRRRVAEHRYEVAWRVDAMRALAGDDGWAPPVIAAAPSTGSYCECCGEAQDRERVPRSVLCCLATARLVEDRRGRQARPRETVA